MKLRHAIKLGCAWLAACSSTPAQDDGGAVDAATDVAQDNFVGPSDAGADGKPLGAPRLYVGSGDGNIRIFAFDDQAATLTPIATVAAGGNPSFLASGWKPCASAGGMGMAMIIGRLS